MSLTVDQLRETARRCRVDTLKELHLAKSGHPGSALSSMDFMVALYFGGFVRPAAPGGDELDRDLFVLSVGHAVPGLYACLVHAGHGSYEDLQHLRRLGGLQGHAKRNSFPGIETSSGSLGQGLGVGLGAALGMRYSGRERRVFVLMSDGEQQEGSVWESVMLAASQRVSNLVAIVDKNGNQINGATHDIMPSLDSLEEKYAAFGWRCRTIDGNDMAQVVEALEWACAADGPAAIIGETQTGYPLSFMMGDYHWHHGVITDELLVRSLGELGQSVSASPDDSWLPGGW